LLAVPSRPTFTEVDPWAQREAQVLSVTLQGLKALAEESPTADDEDTLNWALAAHIRQAVLAGRRTGDVSLEPPALEPRSMSVGPVSVGPETRDRKRPDLVWAWCDDQASVDQPSFLEMVIECKRLGSGDLCRLYVAKGVARFQNEEHAYAKHMRSGFMVGYLQEIAVDDAKRRVGKILKSEGLAPLTKATRPGATFDQRLRRPYAFDPFDLNHLWQCVPPAAE
jgi:hypothetical protein